MNKIFFSILFASIAISLHAQDAAFTQYNSSPLYLNPAFAGSAGCSRVVASYRNQWPDLSGNFVTTNISYDQYIRPIRGGLGLTYLRDNEAKGTFITNTFGLIYSPHFNIKDKITIKPAWESTYMQKSIDWSNLIFGDQIDTQDGFIYRTNEQIGSEAMNAVDFSTGLLIYTNKLYGGFAVHHLFEPNIGFLTGAESRLPLKATVHFGYIFGNGDSSKFSFSPSILFIEQQNFLQLNTTLSFRYKWLLWGVAYRNKDAFVLMLGLKSKKLRVGYSYDTTVSKLDNQNTHGSHEVSLSVLFNCKNKKDRINTMNVLAF